jgi:hypothetical protein
MATFKGQVTQDGWSVQVETGEAGYVQVFAVASVEKLAETFIEAQTGLQAEGQKFVRETLNRESSLETNGQTETCNIAGCWFCEAKINKAKYDTTEAENLTDSKISGIAT